MAKGKPLSIRLPNNWLEALKTIAREKAYKEDKDISYLTLIENAVFEKYIRDFDGDIDNEEEC